jgi:L-seryl-tRNA(Ser) seleniumtransferase
VIDAHGLATVKTALRQLQSLWRACGTEPEWAVDAAGYARELNSRLNPLEYQPVFNLTGTIIHTNLGRSILSEELYDAVRPLVTQPMNLEFNLETGKRGDRDAAVERRLCVLTGAEAATVVNNNAAALMLVLNTFALGKRVPVSRGELIEIGGSFRLPELMTRAGCELLEVGTTNRTHLKDFRAAAAEPIGLLLKVHPSNFHISGFTKSVSVREMADLAHEYGLPLCVDLGSGTLVDLAKFGLPHEPMPQEVLAQGADLVTFSGDKLLGSVQAGLIVGRKVYVDACKTNPMKRALRPDKLTLAFLDKTLALYESAEELPDQLPLLRIMTAPLDALQQRAELVRDSLAERLGDDWKIEVTNSECQIERSPVVQ